MLLAWTIFGIVITMGNMASPEVVKKNSATSYSDRLIPRSQWTSHPDAKKTDLTKKPARYALVAHTAGIFCNSRSSCEKIVHSIEEWNIQIGFDLISYNFLIGGDGNIYEGRGWGKMGATAKGYNCDSISIAFIGNFEKDNLNQDMIDAFNMLIDQGLNQGELSNNFKLFGHNQVSQTISPGLHITEVIQSWQHWSKATETDVQC
uniref:Peptidoglycan-recognition protein S2-like protein n=1 Tax=Anasa tristis TaxID=236421 RepID=I6R2G0_ANATI|nr:peptidoglycan-recognition protein S2-like protein [Anasa tristis]